MYIIKRYLNKAYNSDYQGYPTFGPDENIFATADDMKASNFVNDENNKAHELRKKIIKWNEKKSKIDKQYQDQKYPDTYKELINFNNSELGIKFIHEYCENPRAYSLMADRFNTELKRILYKDIGEDPSEDFEKYAYDFSFEEVPEL